MNNKTRNIICYTIVVLIGISFLLAGTGVAMTWYHKAEVESATENQVKENTGNKDLVIYDPMNIEYDKMTPGFKATKTFSIQNRGSKTISYSIVWKEITNSFTKPEDVVLSLTSDNDGGKISNVPIPETGTNIDIISNISIGPNIVQNYKIEFNYLKTANINDNKTRNITGIISAVSIN